jgi:alanine racemase
VALLRDIPAGDTVSYNRRWTAERPTRLAVLPIGYADGLPRRAGNGVVSVWFGDQAAPIVGTVCMDMCMVDVTGLDVAVGDMALLFGAGHPVSELAERLGTIPYEVLTSIAQRVKRVHVRGSV